MTWRQIGILVPAAAALLLGCGADAAGVTGADTPICPQTAEFGNYGCIEIRGVVRNRAGEALPGFAVVGVHGVNPGSWPAVSGVNTDSLGGFDITAVNYFGPAGGDTISVYVIADDIRAAGFEKRSPLRDSVLALASYAPVGAARMPVQVTITLPE